MSDLAAPPPESEAMADLVRRIVAGNPSAEAELVQRFSRAVSFLLRRLAREETVVEDLYQETFRLVIEKVRAGELREAERLPGFVSAMARNLFLGSVRRGGRRQKWQGDAEAAEAAPDPAPGQLSRLLAQERATIVRRVLAELKNDRDREILSRYYIVDQDKEEICRDLDLSDLHFNRVLFRARQRYRELFEKRQGPGVNG
ncbi:MAG TPA: RNA polymerase sigma factor [Thermoanaerobaculia bacterium]|jgi:RNA polymerase sigma-70 factor (ECF subfamily)|nr:RNA polymerase sigma factor [Thermoanaerobaculia bacterium]